jgi:hypothetical protein
MPKGINDVYRLSFKPFRYDIALPQYGVDRVFFMALEIGMD